MSTNHAKCALLMPHAYDGEVRRGSGDSEAMWSVVLAATYFDLPPLLKRCGDWAVSREGIHCLTTQYEITRDRLGEEDWLAHMTEKKWVNQCDFHCVFHLAKDMVEAGII